MSLKEIIYGVAVVLLLVSGSKCDEEKNSAELMLSASHFTNELLFYENPEDHVYFRLFTRSTNDTEGQLLVINNLANLNLTDFDAARKTLFVIHGFKDSLRSPVFQDIKNAALESYDFNVIGVDWSYYTNNVDYVRAYYYVKPVGVYLGQFVEYLMNNGVSGRDLHLTGHSLGAHIAGFAGKRLTADGQPIARITGLDPAFPGYYNLDDPTVRLDRKDAEYVDCIHTCGGILGIPNAICQADFYPNRGQNVQPGCSLFDFGACSHGRSFKYFAESFNASHQFVAQSCNTLFLWVPTECEDQGALMGYPAGTEQYRGLFSLTTNKKTPFAKTIKASSNR